MKKAKQQHKLNREITAPQVRVGEHGILNLKEALAMADAQEMDLVLISETAVPPVKLF